MSAHGLVGGLTLIWDQFPCSSLCSRRLCLGADVSAMLCWSNESLTWEHPHVITSWGERHQWGIPIDAGSRYGWFISWKVHLYMDDSCGYPHDYGNLHDLKMVDFPSINDHHFWWGGGHSSNMYRIMAKSQAVDRLRAAKWNDRP